MPRTPLCLIPVLLLLAVAPTLASQAPGHIYVALKAREAAPAPVRAIIDGNLQAYLAGATGPDIALTTYLVQEALGWEHPGSEAHYDRTGQLIVNMLKLASALPDEAARIQGQAFALGWLTHYSTDVTIHPLVNEMGGYFGAGGERIVRHKVLELVEAEHVFQKNFGDLSNYRITSTQVPVQLITAAFHETFPEKNEYDAGILGDALTFWQDLSKSALIMAYSTDWFVNVHLKATSYTGPVISTVLKGTPPTPEEYEKIVKNPLTIDKVEVEPADPAAGRDKAYLKVTYSANDLLLYKVFCDQWNVRIGNAVNLASSNFAKWGGNPSGFKLFDRNLDTGGPIASHYDTATEWPGKPDITSLLAYVEIKDDKGKDVSPMWGKDGTFVPIPFTVPGTGGPDDVVGPVQDLPGWNGGKAGQCFMRVPFDNSAGGEYTAKLRLVLARKPDKKPYGWEDQGHIVEAKWEGPISGKPELSILFLVDTSGSMGGGKIAAARAAVKASVAQTDDKKTEWCLVRFGGCSVNVVCRFTMDPKKLQTAADTLGTGGDTPYIYGREKALAYLVARGRGKTGRLVILCDGQDNCPEHGSASQPEAAAQLRKLMQIVQPATPGGGGTNP